MKILLIGFFIVICKINEKVQYCWLVENVYIVNMKFILDLSQIMCFVITFLVIALGVNINGILDSNYLGDKFMKALYAISIIWRIV